MLRSIVRAGLLSGTVLLPWCAAHAETVAADSAEQIVVSGTRPITQASSGTKSDVPLVETPQSISVIDATTLAELGTANLNQALRFVAGVTPETRGANAEVYDLFKLRGFDAPVYLDGLRQFISPTGYAAPQVDVSRIDRLEVVKGPASVLYGQSSPGGLVAISSKLPLDRGFYGAVSGTYGTYDLYRVDADVGGRLSRDVLWRIYGSANGADTQQSFGKRRRETVSGAVTFNMGAHDSLTLLAAYSHDPDNGNYGGAPAWGTLFPNPNGKISTKFADGEPDGFWHREQQALTYMFNHRFGDSGWTFRSNGRYQHVSTKLGEIYSTGAATDATLTTFGRGSYATHEALNIWTFDNQLSGTIETGPITHSILIGLDRQVIHTTELAAFGVATPINAYDPVYGTSPVPQTPADAGTPFAYNVHQRQTGLYAQDQMALGGFRLTLSGRQDWVRTVYSGDEGRDHKFTYRIGALYLTDFGLAPYVSYSTSFQPQVSLTATGLAKPSFGKQIEAGLKYQMPGVPMLITASWFRIEQTNVLTSTADFLISAQSGKVRSQGYEFEANAPLPYGFSVRAAYSHQKIKTLEDLNPLNIGHGLVGAGKGNAALNLDWAPKAGPLAGLMVGGAVRWVDKVYGGLAGTAFGAPHDNAPTSTPSYTLFDALLRYDLGKAFPRLSGIEVGINATNITDKKYLTSCYLNGAGWCWYGQRRTVQGTIGFRW
jgi:iron complex outermembrane receptor protein